MCIFSLNNKRRLLRIGGKWVVVFRGGHGSGQHTSRLDTSPLKARSDPLSATWAWHGQEFLYQVRTDTISPRWSVSRTTLSFVFSVKLSKQHKTRALPAGGTSPWSWAGPWTKSENFRTDTIWSDTLELGLNRTRHFPKNAGRAHEQARPMSKSSSTPKVVFDLESLDNTSKQIFYSMKQKFLHDFLLSYHYIEFSHLILYVI